MQRKLTGPKEFALDPNFSLDPNDRDKPSHRRTSPSDKHVSLSSSSSQDKTAPRRKSNPTYRYGNIVSYRSVVSIHNT